MKKLATLTLVLMALTLPIAADLQADAYSGYSSGCGEECDDSGMMPGFEMYVYGDWLLWKTRRCGLDYVIPNSGDPLAVALGASTYVGNPVDYNAGFRLGFGARSCDSFDIAFRYTHYQCKSDSSYAIEGEPARTIRTNPIVAGLLPISEFALSRYRIDYNVFDIEIGRMKTVDCSSFTYRPFVGAKFAFIDEDLNTSYALFVETPPLVGVYESIELGAYGLSIGLDVRADVRGCLGLYVRGATSLLAGDYEITHRDAFFNGDETLTFTTGKHWCLLGNVELAAGLDYVLYNQCGTLARLAIGYEFQHWINTQDFFNYLGDNRLGAVLTNNQSNLGFDGLVLRGSVEF